MTVFLIRHGQTQSNLERRYIGVSDESLCRRGREALAGIRLPAVDRVYASPLRRCRETAALLYPGVEPVLVPGLRETDMGAFEGHTYEELKDDSAYQAWLDTAGTAAPPGGESGEAVRRRAVAAFLSIAEEPAERIALVIHGGTIMTLLEALEPSHRFYCWQVPNGGGYRCRWADGALTVEERAGREG